MPPPFAAQATFWVQPSGTGSGIESDPWGWDQFLGLANNVAHIPKDQLVHIRLKPGVYEGHKTLTVNGRTALKYMTIMPDDNDNLPELANTGGNYSSFSLNNCRWVHLWNIFHTWQESIGRI